MNLNLYDGKSFQSLGMIRVKGSMKSEKAIELVQGRLAKFNLNLDTDIVATITDEVLFYFYFIFYFYLYISYYYYDDINTSILVIISYYIS